MLIYNITTGASNLIWQPLFFCLFSDKYPNEQVPTLDEMVELCLEIDLMMFIDVKSNVKLVR